MSVPGFIAEASLYRTGGYYKGANAGQDSVALVVPAVCGSTYVGECIGGYQTYCEKGRTPVRVECDVLEDCWTDCGPCVPGPCNTQTCTRGPNSMTCTDCNGTRTIHNC